MQQNKIKYGINSPYIKSLKIPKLLSQSIGHFLNIKQIMDDKNNFSIVDKINQLKNLIKCMKKKIALIQKVERRRKDGKMCGNLIDDITDVNLDLKRDCLISLRKLDGEMKSFEILE